MSEENKRVLIVEDDSAILDIYKTIFKKSNFEIDSAESGKDTLRILDEIRKGEHEKPGVVLLDLILPDMDGIDLLKNIKGDSATKDIKVFIMTNKESIGTDLPEEMKPDEFIVKANVNPMQIVDLVEKHLK